MSPPGKSPSRKPPAAPPPGELEARVKRELKRLGKRLREARLARGLSQEQAAELIGVHAKYMPRLESGGANPTVATLVAASAAYGLTLCDLFSADEEGSSARDG